MHRLKSLNLFVNVYIACAVNTFLFFSYFSHNILQTRVFWILKWIFCGDVER